MDTATFLADIRADPVNAGLIGRLASLGLPECLLVAGCLFQAAWNRRSGRPPGWSVRDYDVAYFDGLDLSYEAEDAVIARVRAATADLGVVVEPRNQARVHLWYEGRFGTPCPPLASTREGIDRYLVACTCVGLDVATGELHAPDGLADLYAGRLAPNPRNPSPRFGAKAESYRARWPWLTIVG